MPIKRYRTFEEAQRAQQLPSGDPRIPDRLRQVLTLWARLRPVTRPPGLHRFRSAEDWSAWRATVQVQRPGPGDA
ncbi:MAG: hypothetical protein ABL977_14910 [Candidatus Eisenbacteria bacterium]